MKKRSNLTGRSFSDGIELSKDGKHSLVYDKKANRRQAISGFTST